MKSIYKVSAVGENNVLFSTHSAYSMSTWMLGRVINQYKITKDGVQVVLTSSECTQIERDLAAFQTE